MSELYCILAHDARKYFRGFVALGTGQHVSLTYDEPYKCSLDQAQQIAAQARNLSSGMTFTVERASP